MSNNKNKINIINQKFNKFCKTKRAINLVKDINYLDLNTIYERYNINYLKKIKSKSKIREYIRNILKENNIVDYTIIPNKSNIKYNTKLPKSLTKKELQQINKNKIIHFGIADRLHRLEEHKIDRWEKKHRPSFEILRNDLFPREIIKAFLDKKAKKLEDIRNNICNNYINYDIILRRHKTKNDDIIEEKIGTIKDKTGILRKTRCYFTLNYLSKKHNNIKKIYNTIENIKENQKNKFKSEFICLKLMIGNKIYAWV